MSPITKIGLSLALLVGVASLTPPAAAQTGVDDNRVSLPQGPGSLEGVGDDVELDPNMGAMTYGVGLRLPSGFPGASPGLSLSYSSASGSGPVGIGWSMRVPAIGRMTSRGAPEYDTDDLFDVGGNELVQVGADGGDLIYRERFEGAFVRYRWVSAGTGAEGYWIAENPDGSRSYFGADAQGNLQPAARRSRPQGGTAEYGLVEMVDPYGHAVRYTYGQANGTVPLLTRIQWLDDGTGDADLYAVEIDYEARPDYLSDASRGYEELTADRVAAIRVLGGTTVIREYVLTYEDDAAAGGFSRLAQVEQYGRGGRVTGAKFPVVERFAYSQALGVECTGAACDRPYLVDMGVLSGGVSIANGRATLVDINADGLPDVLDTTDAAGHRFLINTLTPNGDGFDHTFASPVSSAVAGTGSFQLGGTGRLQTFDVNGDGLSDLLNATTGAWLENGGLGDWAGARTFGDISTLAGLDLSTARFIDIDDDKRIDLVTSTGQTTTLYRNQGDQFSAESIASIGVAFGGTGHVEFADMNGDGLNDPVELRTDGSVRYRLNLGHGQWSAAWRSVTGLSVSPTDVARAELEDLNGDGLADIVIVDQTQIKYAVNRNGARFDPFVTITSADVDGDLPARVAGVTVLLADMNANGSQDVVWFLTSGSVEYLELFPRRPNLLTRVTNGIGSVQDIAYTTAVEEQARARAAGAPWTYALPIPMQLVARIDRYVTLTGNEDGTGLHEITTTTYRDGFYDGVEKQYRGFERVSTTIAKDEFQEEAKTSYVFDVGRTAPHRNGLTLSTILESDGRILRETTSTYAECDLAEVPAPAELIAQGRRAVYFPCSTVDEVLEKEGLQTPAQWKTVRTEMTYDGYGNVTQHAALGVVGVDGDELYTETEYVQPDTRWLLGLPSRERVYDAPGITDFSETLTYYDGESFVGLPLGQATEGFVSRVTQKVDVDGTILNASRSRRDTHGNVVETIDPNGTLDDATSHRRSYTYDDTGFFLVTTDLAVGDHVLRRESRYDRNYQQPVEVTRWMLVVDGTVETNRDSHSYRYDDFGRISAELLPGDDLDKPSRVYGYELGTDVSRIVVQSRSTPNGELDEESFKCIDGRGRSYQTRVRIAAGRYQVSGFKAFNARGATVQRWQPWVDTTGTCAFDVPAGVLSTTMKYDALGRVVETTKPGASIYGEDTVERMVYRPLAVDTYDSEDTDSNGAHADTPVTTTMDGLGRTVAIERSMFVDGALAHSGEQLHYDSTGTFSGYTNAEGHRHHLKTDLLGRTVEVSNPNLGTITYVYDDASNPTSITDGRGVVQRRAYDALNRIVERWNEADRDGSLVEWHYDSRLDRCPATTCTNLPGEIAAVTYPVRLVDGTTVSGADLFGYDVRRRAVVMSRALDTLATLTTRVSYDNQDRVLATTSPDGTVVERTYDDAGRVTAVPGYVTEYTYDDRGLPARMTLENRATVGKTYDALMRLARIHHADGSGAAIHDLALTLDRAHNVQAVADTAGGTIDLSASFTLDDWYRVEEVAYPDRTQTFLFDVLDRITAIDGSEVVYDASKPLAVTTTPSSTLEYDDGGHLVRRNAMSLERDELGRIASVMHAGQRTGVHAYAEVDRVLQMTTDGTLVLYGFDRYEVRDGVGTTFVSLGDERVARRETTGLDLPAYADLNGNAKVDAGDARGAGDRAVHVLAAAASRLLVEQEAPTAFLHTDHLGSHVAATNADGEVRGRQAFLVHGNLRAAEGYVGTYGFTGQERDETTALIAMKHRNLDPETGRWDRFDPSFVTLDAGAMSSLGEAATGYAYVANAASTQVDPSGLTGKPKVRGRRNGAIRPYRQRNDYAKARPAPKPAPKPAPQPAPQPAPVQAAPAQAAPAAPQAKPESEALTNQRKADLRVLKREIRSEFLSEVGEGGLFSNTLTKKQKRLAAEDVLRQLLNDDKNYVYNEVAYSNTFEDGVDFFIYAPNRSEVVKVLGHDPKILYPKLANAD